MATDLSLDNLKQLRFKWRMHLAGDRKLGLLYQLVILNDQIKRILSNKDPRERLVGKNTELVIDGFQGSANSFATAAFRSSQTQPVRLAHHLHSPVQIIRAVEQNIPVILFIREPIGTILSLTSRWSYISVNSGLRSYINFYSRLEPLADKCVLSNFEYTTQHFDLIVQNTNRRFLTNFDLIDMHKAQERHTPPQSKRKELKQQKKQEFDCDINQQLLRDAQEIYQKFELLSQKTY